MEVVASVKTFRYVSVCTSYFGNPFNFYMHLYIILSKEINDIHTGCVYYKIWSFFLPSIYKFSDSTRTDFHFIQIIHRACYQFCARVYLNIDQ